ncbi:hypothetical protein DdX_08412 [Ditylenchus destructor]|uniref:F-box domain-containing protein n=1 Tax=Ditylenchus destructor TaxID=166010 RepID=A0AAD4R0R2_9BILA|nr:hypothetical protein DdX_08412 [Ditylenchus destructor]
MSSSRLPPVEHLCGAFSFLARDDLDTMALVSRQFRKVTDKYFPNAPFRVLKSVTINTDFDYPSNQDDDEDEEICEKCTMEIDTSVDCSASHQMSDEERMEQSKTMGPYGFEDFRPFIEAKSTRVERFILEVPPHTPWTTMVKLKKNIRWLSTYWKNSSLHLDFYRFFYRWQFDLFEEIFPTPELLECESLELRGCVSDELDIVSFPINTFATSFYRCKRLKFQCFDGIIAIPDLVDFIFTAVTHRQDEFLVEIGMHPDNIPYNLQELHNFLEAVKRRFLQQTSPAPFKIRISMDDDYAKETGQFELKNPNTSEKLQLIEQPNVDGGQVHRMLECLREV